MSTGCSSFARSLGLVRASFAAAICAALAACSPGSGSSLTPASGVSAPDTLAPEAAAKPVVKPQNLAVPFGRSLKAVVSEKLYRGRFSSASKGPTGCAGFATWSPKSGKGPDFSVAVKGVKTGTCTITFSDATKHTAKLKVTIGAAPAPDYVYVVNGGSNDISQLAFDASGTLVAIAPNYVLPPSCVGASGIALAPALNMAFVTCRSATGEVLPLNLNAEHILTASPIAPIAIEYPAGIIVPASGPAGKLYVSSDGAGGGIGAFSISATAMTQFATYTTANDATQMAFYTNAHNISTLYAAANDYGQCHGSGGTDGAIEPWVQSSDGTLVEQTVLPACGAVANLAIANGNLFWAGNTVWGGYSLLQNATLAMPDPPWPAGAGPAYADSMSAVAVQGKTASVAPAFAIGAANSTLYINIKGSGAAVTTYHLPIESPDIAKCHQFDPAFSFQGKTYAYVCWVIASSSMQVFGINAGTATLLSTFPTLGTGPADLAVLAP
jgi:hypothetical protein